MTPGRKATARDLPVLCLLFGGIFAFGALALPLAAKLDVAKKSELYSVSGAVESVSWTSSGKAGRKLHIVVNDGRRVHHLTQNDLSHEVPALRSVQRGDNVTALVRHDFLGRDLEWVWELQRDSVAIVSYEQTRTFLDGERERLLKTARWGGALSIALLFAAIFLRIRFGGWRDSSLSREAVN